MPAIYARADKAWGSAIRGARTQAGLTQEALASKLKLPQQVVSKLETGRRPLKAGEIPIVARAVKMTPTQLFKVFLSLYEA